MEFMSILKGTPVSSGTAEGIAVIVDRHDFMKQDFEEGSILVTEMTEPSMILMMNKAAAIVTEVGGITSHAAIVSRELGIPCVTAAKGAMTMLSTGMKVRVNGTTGEIFVL